MSSLRRAAVLALTLLAVACGGVEQEPIAPESNDAVQVVSESDALSGHLSFGEEAVHGPIEVRPGDVLSATLRTTGGARLYVKFGGVPTTLDHDASAKTGVRLSSRASSTEAYLLVIADSETGYDLDVRHSIALGAAPAAPALPALLARFEGELDAGMSFDITPFTVTPGRRVVLTLDGAGDADLTARFDGAPTADAFDCLGISEGPDTCELVVPEGARELHVRVVAIQNARWTLVAAER